MSLSNRLRFEILRRDGFTRQGIFPLRACQYCGSKAPDVKRSREFELIPTSDESLQTPERIVCYRLISAMPESALSEVKEALKETLQHYLDIEEVRLHLPEPPPDEIVTAKISDHILIDSLCRSAKKRIKRDEKRCPPVDLSTKVQETQ